MRSVYLLTIRQLSGRWRILIMAVLATMPALLALIAVADDDAQTVIEFETVVLSAVLAGSIIPLVVLAIAAAAFANEIEDRTLANLTLSPVPRWQIVVAKLLACITVATPFILASALATSHIAFLADPLAMLSVGLSSVVAVVLYATFFVWLGLVTTQAIGLGLLYIVLWEGFFTGYVQGMRLLSIRHYAIALMHGLDERRFAGPTHLGLTPTVIVVLAVVLLFSGLAIRRLRRMDVP